LVAALAWVVSGYTFLHDVSRGNVGDAVGSGAEAPWPIFFPAHATGSTTRTPPAVTMKPDGCGAYDGITDLIGYEFDF
jgi:hypothetical protein